MRLKNETIRDLHDTMVNCFVEEIQQIGCDDCIERMTEIIGEGYPKWSDDKCKEVAERFYSENRDNTYDEACLSFEPTPREEAMTDLAAGRL